jgi:prevent-host-death family protein
MRVLGVAEARSRLPELIRKVAGGHPPIPIGRRGRPEVVLAAPSTARPNVERRSLAGLVEVVGSWDELERAQEEIRLEMSASLDRTARMIGAPSGKRRRRLGAPLLTKDVSIIDLGNPPIYWWFGSSPRAAVALRRAIHYIGGSSWDWTSRRSANASSR